MTSELESKINAEIPDAAADYQITISTRELGRLMRDAMATGAHLLLHAAIARQFELSQHKSKLHVVEVERLKRYVGEK